FPAAADRIGADALRVRINESLARKDYLTARWYERRGERVGAAHLYRRLVQDYPLTAAAKTAIERLDALDVPLPGGIAPAESGDGAAPAPATAPLLEDPS
ncbi:MAG TPA: outer membrane protein assembly factor BamD, partial [Phycisphaeraceae bacterium]